MGSSWYHLLGNDYVRLLILDLVFTFYVLLGIRKKHFPYWALLVPSLTLFSRLSDLAAFVVMLSLAVRFK